VRDRARFAFLGPAGARRPDGFSARARTVAPVRARNRARRRGVILARSGRTAGPSSHRRVTVPGASSRPVWARERPSSHRPTTGAAVSSPRRRGGSGARARTLARSGPSSTRARARTRTDDPRARVSDPRAGAARGARRRAGRAGGRARTVPPQAPRPFLGPAGARRLAGFSGRARAIVANPGAHGLECLTVARNRPGPSERVSE
jgi:hypothetical protein